MSLAETQRAVDQLGIAFWFEYLPPGARPLDERDRAAMQRAFHQALAYGIEVGVTAEQVADAAFYGRRVALGRQHAGLPRRAVVSQVRLRRGGVFPEGRELDGFR